MNPDHASQLAPCPRCLLLGVHDFYTDCIAAQGQELRNLTERLRIHSGALISLSMRHEVLVDQVTATMDQVKWVREDVRVLQEQALVTTDVYVLGKR